MASLQDGLSLAQDLDRLNQLLLPLRSPTVQRLKTSPCLCKDGCRGAAEPCKSKGEVARNACRQRNVD